MRSDNVNFLKLRRFSGILDIFFRFVDRKGKFQGRLLVFIFLNFFAPSSDKLWYTIRIDNVCFKYIAHENAGKPCRRNNNNRFTKIKLHVYGIWIRPA